MKYIISLIFFLIFNCSGKDNHHHHEHNQHDKHDHEVKNKNKSLEAHEHGVSVLNIAQDDSEIEFEFEMPGFDVVGFEFEAKKKDDIKKVKNAIKILLNYKNMIALPKEALCKNIYEDAKIFNEGNHSEFISQYKFECEKISLVENIKVLYFQSFELSKALKVNIVGKGKSLFYQIDSTDSILNTKNLF